MFDVGPPLAPWLCYSASICYLIGEVSTWPIFNCTWKYFDFLMLTGTIGKVQPNSQRSWSGATPTLPTWFSWTGVASTPQKNNGPVKENEGVLRYGSTTWRFLVWPSGGWKKNDQSTQRANCHENIYIPGRNFPYKNVEAGQVEPISPKVKNTSTQYFSLRFGEQISTLHLAAETDHYRKRRISTVSACKRTILILNKCDRQK